MVGGRGPRRAAAMVLVLAVGAVWFVARGRAGGPSQSEPDPEARRAVLVQLAGRLLPASDGGWVLGDFAPTPTPDRWLLAAVAAGANPPADTVDSLSPLDLAVVLSVPGVEVPDAEQRAADLVSTARAHLAQRDLHGLAVVLQLSNRDGPAGADARAAVVALAGDPGCNRLDGQANALPAPGAELTVLLRALAASGTACPQAREVLDQTLLDPRWDSPWVVSEFTDLAVVAAPRTAEQQAALAEHLDHWEDPGNGEVTDLTTLVQLRRSRAILRLGADLPEAVRVRLDAQQAARGRLADRSTSSTSAFDAVAVRHLRQAGLVSPTVEAATTQSATTSLRDDDPVGSFLLEGQLPSCAVAATPLPSAARVTVDRLVEAAVRRVVHADCAGTLTAGTLLSGTVAENAADVRPLADAAAVLAACRVDPSVVQHLSAPGVAPALPRDADPLVLLAAEILLDPVAACTAEGL